MIPSDRAHTGTALQGQEQGLTMLSGRALDLGAGAIIPAPPVSTNTSSSGMMLPPPSEVGAGLSELPTRTPTLNRGAVVPAPPVGTSASLPAAAGMMTPVRIEFGEVQTPIRPPALTGGIIPPPMGATMPYREGVAQGPTRLHTAEQSTIAPVPPAGAPTLPGEMPTQRTGLEMTPQATFRNPDLGFSAYLRSTGRDPPGYTNPQAQTDRASTPPLSEVLALAEALNGARDRSLFNTRMLSSLPHLKDVSVENYINQVELLYERPEHRVRAARTKLTDECNFILEMETKDSIPLTWEAMKLALLSTRKRSSTATLVEYQQFRQNSNESILKSWSRFMGLARTAEVTENKSSLWNYFRGRLTQEAKLLFRAELAERDPYSALAKIADAGDIPTYSSRPAILAFQERRDPEERQGTLGKCFRCFSPDHRIRDCPIPPSDDRPRPGQDRQNRRWGGGDKPQTPRPDGRKDKDRRKRDNFHPNKKGRNEPRAEAVVPATKPPAISAAAPVAVTPGAGRIKPEVIRAYQPLLNSESLMGL